jgi:hypothetical protein
MVTRIFSTRTLSSVLQRRPSNTSLEIRMNRETQIKAMLLPHLKQTGHRGTLSQKRNILGLMKIDGKFTRTEVGLCIYGPLELETNTTNLVMIL